MIRYCVQRVVSLVPVLVIVGLLTFALVRVIPGDPAQVLRGESASPDEVAAVRHQLGLDQPVWLQFGQWVGSVVTGDLGDSFSFNQPVLSVIADHYPPTLSIVLLASAFTVLLAIPLGILSAVKRGTPLDSFGMALALLGTAMPEFWTGMVLGLVFAVGLRWVPVAGYQSPTDGVLAWLSTIVLPAVALGLSQVGVVARMLRDGLIDASADAYTTTARAKGLSPRQVIWDHALRNTLVPTLTVLGNSIGGLLAGAVIIETVFNIRGFGWLAVQAVLQRDYPLVQGCVLLAAVTYSLVNLLVDISYGIVDPRIRIT
jgi:peptide/nickel transport system permease protein